MDFLLESLPQCLINGLTRGSIYALIAIGFTIVYNSTDAINFAQGEFSMLGGMIAVSLAGAVAGLGLVLPTWVYVPFAALAVMAVASAFELGAINPARKAAPVNLVIITIGGSILLKGIAMLIWGKDDLMLAPFSAARTIRLGPVGFELQSVWVWAATLIAVVLLHLFFRRTIAGKALRACAQDRTAGALMGIDAGRMTLIAFALAGAIGALAGVIVTPLIYVNYFSGTLIGLKGFCASVLGGMGSIPGAVVGGLAIGVLEQLFGTYLSTGYMDAFAFVVMLAVLLVRPSGLLGEPEGDRA